MRFTSALLAASAFTGALANGFNPFSPIPGYPLGNGFCLTDAQANFAANTFKSILTNPDRQGANATSQTFIAQNYVETSDSINTLAGFPIGGPTFSGKQAFIYGVVLAQAIPSMTTLDVFHDCTKVSWRWNINGLGLNVSPVKGINDMVVNPLTGVLQSNNLEFNSIAWGRDTGWTCTPPPSQV